MLTYYHRTCDRAGTTLREDKLEASSLRHAMAQANGRLCSTAGLVPSLDFDPHGRIEIADDDGTPVARIYFSEVLSQ